jgi:signal transduction histidine kinase
MKWRGWLGRFSLMRRVVWAVLGTVALLVGLQTGLAFSVMHVQEDELTDELLRREVQHLIELTVRPGLMPVGQLDASPRVKAYLTRGREGIDAVPLQIRDLAPGFHVLQPHGHDWHIAVVETDDGLLRVVLDATESEDRVNHFGWTLLALWAGCVAVTAWIARAVARIAVGPIVEATHSIARWAPEARPPAGLEPDEAATLMETFNRFRDSVDDTVAREREFAANLDHEIRTPLTTIRTDAELIAIEGPLAPEQHRRLERITSSVDEIIETTQSTLSSSAGRAAPPESADLHDCVRTACDAMADRATTSGLGIEIEVQAGETLMLDRQALLTVCRNLVRNAIEHAAPATLTITGGRDGLTFRDDGPGIPAANLPYVFERYHRGHRADDASSVPPSPRRGLGLAIARRLCDIQGWRLSVASSVSAPHRGTEFRIEFGEPAASFLSGTQALRSV